VMEIKNVWVHASGRRFASLTTAGAADHDRLIDSATTTWSSSFFFQRHPKVFIWRWCGKGFKGTSLDSTRGQEVQIRVTHIQGKMKNRQRRMCRSLVEDSNGLGSPTAMNSDVATNLLHTKHDSNCPKSVGKLKLSTAVWHMTRERWRSGEREAEEGPEALTLQLHPPNLTLEQTRSR
jgi:hypothetical protein